MNKLRISITEEVWDGEPFARLISDGRQPPEVEALFGAAGARVRRALGLDDNPLQLQRRRLRAKNIAGVLRIAPGVELEIAPKFLGARGPDWRRDMLAVMAHSGHGRLLSDALVSASPMRTTDLASLIGQAFVDSYSAARHRPLRTYETRKWRSWSVTGEIFPPSLAPPDPAGALQRASVFTSRNPHMSVLAAAAERLGTEVADPGVRARLAAVRRAIGHQEEPVSPLPPLAGRHQRWRPVLTLAEQILSGFDLSLEAGQQAAPGFLLRSWEAWEALLAKALRMASPPGTVRPHLRYTIGTRDGSTIEVNPDLTVDGAVPYLADAKYRASVERGALTVSRDALYEALAFARAAGRTMVVLLYPRTPHAGQVAGTLGSASVFSRVEADGIVVLGTAVEVRGIGAGSGFRRFSKQIVADLSVIAR